MGASHSVVGDQSVPVELVIKILSYLAVADLTSCRCINHTLRDIIDASPDLQHQIDTALAGVVDNYRITLSLPERRRALRLEQEAWDSCKPQFTKFCFPDFIQDSIYFKLHHPDSKNCVGYCCPPLPEQSSDQPWSYLSHLPKRLDCEIISLAVCLEANDLVALGVR
jgi:F-box domain